MSNIDKAAELFYRNCNKVMDAYFEEGIEFSELPSYEVEMWREAAHDLADAGLLAPEPKIIHTQSYLVALDPDTMLADSEGICQTWNSWMDWANLTDEIFPLVVIAPGGQVRTACEALEQA